MKRLNWNVAAISGVMGNVLERYKYDGFGRRTVLSADAVVEKSSSEYNWNRAFTGQVLDSEIGLMLYRMRYYNVSLGRWTSRDPIGYEAGDENLYRYVGNGTLNFEDPMGFQLAPGWEVWSPSRPNQPNRNDTTPIPPPHFKHLKSLNILCDGLDSCEAKKKGCSKEKCLEFIEKIAVAMSYADYWTSGIAGKWYELPRWEWLPICGQGRCHEWSRLFQSKLDESNDFYVQNIKQICLRWPDNSQMKIDNYFTPVHNLNILTSTFTGKKLVVDDGFLKGMGQIYTPEEAKQKGWDIYVPPPLSN